MTETPDYTELAQQYAADVLDAKFPACQAVIQAIKRHRADLHKAETDPSYPFYFDFAAGVRVCQFLAALTPSKWRGTIVLAPWQAFVITVLYGWKKRDSGLRRFQVAYLRLPRKTGKSMLGSGLGLYHLVGDGEPGAEVYSVALTRDQARRVFDEAVAMRDKSPALAAILAKSGENPCNQLSYPDTAGLFKPLSRDKETMEGLNVSCAIADEVHKWDGRDTWDVVSYGMEAREQPLMIAITTAPAAEDTTSICNTLDNHSMKVLGGIVQDDVFFTFITELDKDDPWDDESLWIKACPNLGVTVKLETMRKRARDARNQPDSLNAFKRYSLNIRVGAEDAAIPIEQWDTCASGRTRGETLTGLTRRPVYLALDLAQTTDTSALAGVFVPENLTAPRVLVSWFWIPEDNIKARCERDRVPYDLWRDMGLLATTPGNVTDYAFIVQRILELRKQFDVKELAYDPALATGLVNMLLTSGFDKSKLVKFAQTAMNYAAPCGDFQRAVARQEIQHDADPMLRWQVSNLRWRRNHTNLIMPDKEKSIERIDGAVASIMAYGRATHPDNARRTGRVTTL